MQSIKLSPTVFAAIVVAGLCSVASAVGAAELIDATVNDLALIAQDAEIVSSSDVQVETTSPQEAAQEAAQVPDPDQETDIASRLVPPQPIPRQPIPPQPRRSARQAFLGAVAASFSATPAMIGDDIGASLMVLPGGSRLSVGGGDRRFKIAENNSPIPRDRVLFNYHHFHNSVIDANGVEQNRNRYTLGIEKTFLDEMASLELRLPISRTLDHVQQIGAADTMSGEAGNLGLSLKTILLQGRRWVFTAGTTMTVPTGSDYQLLDAGGLVLFDVDNDAIHVAPYLGLLVLGRDDYFLQAFVQTDFDLNGDDVRTGNTFRGVLQEQNLLMVDLSLGRWIYRTGQPNRCLTALAFIGELHYAGTMNDTDTVVGITNPQNRVDLLNATGALHFQFGNTTARVGASAPLRQASDRMFDAEVIVQLNRYF